MARSYMKENVLEAARARTARLFDEFPVVMVASSGGKDSTCVMHLALEEAEKRGRLPLRVFFVDQEAEWDCTVEYMRKVRDMPGIALEWLQIPFKLLS